ncbi:MAG: fatty acyl-CoA reductase [Desulfohalobiaceae bacterium]
MPPTQESTVLQQLKGKQVLLTGASGFLGKVLLEKLIRCVPDIGGITLLLRPGKNAPTAQERFFQDIAPCQVFDRLRQSEPERLQDFWTHKLSFVTGEVTRTFLGLAEPDFVQLTRNIDAIINAAASVNFKQELDQALEINALALRNLSELARRSGYAPLVHVSTCYVHGTLQGSIPEEMLCPDSERILPDTDGTFQVEGLIQALQEKVAERENASSQEKLRERLVKLGQQEARKLGWNDVYTFSKWLGEQLLARELPAGPLSIIRPSIIESTLKEPLPGWIEGVKVADAVIMAYARGRVLFFPGRRSGVLDIIPADLVANSIILALADQLQQPGGPRILQCCSGSKNPLTVGQMIEHVVSEAQENHQALQRLFPERPRLPFVAVNRHLFRLCSQAACIPMRAAEQGLKLLGRPVQGKALEHFRTTMKLADLFGFYSSPKYVFQNDRLLQLASQMKPQDRELFPVHPERIDWPCYIRRVHLPGLNNFALAG